MSYPPITSGTVLVEIVATRPTIDDLANAFGVNHANGDLRRTVAELAESGRIRADETGGARRFVSVPPANAPAAALSPENQQRLAQLTLNSLRKHLRQAHDHATLLCDLTRQGVERRLGIEAGGEQAVGDPEYDRMLEWWAEIGHVMAKADAWPTVCKESGERHAIYTDGSVCRCEVKP
jgi:hypothetical protein